MAKPKNSPARAAEHVTVEDGDVPWLAGEAPSPAAVEVPAGGSEAGTPSLKTATVLQLLRRTEGATLDDLVVATGWLPHSTRAALTGLRKRGHVLTRDRVEGVTRYHILSER